MIAAKGVDAELQGMVRDRITKEPLPGVTIVMTSDKLAGEQTTITEDNGSFFVEGLPAGNYSINVYFNDLTYTGKVDLLASKRSVLAIDLVTTSASEVIELGGSRPTFTDAVVALRAGAVGQAYDLANKELSKQATSKMHSVLAISRYAIAVEALMFAPSSRGDRVATTRVALVEFVTSLDQVKEHLEAAAKDPAFSFELCVACMTNDGNLPGVPAGLFDIERDRSGNDLSDQDVRRQPVYRFDHGDLVWARAMVTFQQAFANIALAYDWSWMTKLNDDGPDPNEITIKLEDPTRIVKARAQLLAGLELSDQCRTEFLAETDDDREWVPNPKQKNYAAPLAVDSKLYQTWADIVADLRLLVTGQTGLSLRAMMSVIDPGAGNDVPNAFLDFGAMLATPKDIILQLGTMELIEKEKNPTKRQKLADKALRSAIGNGYKAAMKPSGLAERLTRMRAELGKGNASIEDKLKYLLWMN
jgi:hypothetical protein